MRTAVLSQVCGSLKAIIQKTSFVLYMTWTNCWVLSSFVAMSLLSSVIRLMLLQVTCQLYFILLCVKSACILLLVHVIAAKVGVCNQWLNAWISVFSTQSFHTDSVSKLGTTRVLLTAFVIFRSSPRRWPSRLELRCVRPYVRPYVHKKFFRFPSNLVCG